MEPQWRTRDGESGFWLKDGTFDDLEPSEMADLIYTSEWSRIDTDAQAEDFLIPLWKRLSLNEKRFVYDLYHKRDTTASEIAMLEDMVADIDAQIYPSSEIMGHPFYVPQDTRRLRSPGMHVRHARERRRHILQSDEHEQHRVAR